MIVFHQKRDFGSLISDTFKFLKVYGKNYFKNYFLINGLLLTLIVVLFVFGYKEFFTQIFGSNLQGQNFFLEQYFQENIGVLIGVTILTFLLFFLFSIINYSYPVFYMKRVGENPEKKIKTDDIIGDIKKNFGKLMILFLGLTFIVSPIFLILFGIAYLLTFIIIGIPLMMMLYPVMMNVVNFIFYNMLHAKKGFFEALSLSMRSQFSYPNHAERSPFWKYLGSTFIMYMILQVVIGIFAFIPMAILFFVLFSNPETLQNNQNPFEGIFGIIFFVIYGFSILLSLILANLLYINAGFLYFDSRTDLHRNKDLEAIESIGTENA